MARVLPRISRDEDGQDVIEYALIAGFISLICYLAIRATGLSASTMWDGVQGEMADVANFF